MGVPVLLAALIAFPRLRLLKVELHNARHATWVSSLLHFVKQCLCVAPSDASCLLMTGKMCMCWHLKSMKLIPELLCCPCDGLSASY